MIDPPQRRDAEITSILAGVPRFMLVNNEPVVKLKDVAEVLAQYEIAGPRLPLAAPARPT